jgi:hypothetical protein
MERKCRVRDWRENPFVRHEQKIGTESPLKRPMKESSFADYFLQGQFYLAFQAFIFIIM